MKELEFIFDESPLDGLLDTLQPGMTLSGVQLLTAAEAESEQALEDALERLEQMQICLDLEGLQLAAAGEQTAQRLKQEEKWVEAGLPVEHMEETDPLRLYLEELAAIPLQADALMLAKQVAMANKEGVQSSAHSRLMELSLSRVVELAGVYAGKGVLLLDLIQEGSVGLWQAIEEFTGEEKTFEAERDRRIRFCMARQILLQAKASGVGQMLRSAMEDYRSVDERLLAELGRNPEPEELAEALHLNLSQILLLSQLVENTRQMHRTTQPEQETLPQEEDQAVEDTAYFQMRQRISDLMSQLTPEDARLISLRYGLEGGIPMKPQQVASRLGITAEEVVAREAAALSKLREIKEN